MWLWLYGKSNQCILTLTFWVRCPLFPFVTSKYLLEFTIPFCPFVEWCSLTVACKLWNTRHIKKGANTQNKVSFTGAPEFTPGFYCGSCYSIFNFMGMFCRSLFVHLSFSFDHCVVVLLWFTDSDYPFGIFKLLLPEHMSSPPVSVGFVLLNL